MTQYQNFEDFFNTFPPESNQYAVIEEYRIRCKEEYMEKRRILVQAICDFISGMTDTYALNEYRKLMC